MHNETSAKNHPFPVVAKLLGYGGVIPFVALAACALVGFDLPGFGIQNTKAMLLNYAAIIVSFIGAVHWGIALGAAQDVQKNLFVYSVLPALFAWALLYFPSQYALLGMAVTVISLYFADRKLLTGIVPEAYLVMRFHLTVVVAFSLIAALIAK